ncbi:MAG: hypothetical protein II795_00410 [Firmicutes bacterium]|nr:hypothetical protein [Bacillota bacterium]
MTNTSLKKNTWIFIGFLLLAGFMNLLTRTDKPVIDVIMACMHDIIFIGLLLFWQQSLRMRILVSKVREYMIWIAGWMLAYMLVRIFRYNIAQGIVVTRYFIYTYRVPQMMIPALFLMICIRIHRGEQPGRWNETLLLIPAVVLSVMVITNDLHNLIYRPSVELSQFVVATGTYTYGIGFYLLYVWMITITVAGLALLYREISRRPTGVIRGLIGIVIIWFAIILLNLLVLDRSLTHGYRMYGIPETDIFCMLGIIEVCIRSRLIPYNENYPGFFGNLRMPAMIADLEYRPVYHSRTAFAADRKKLELAVNGPAALTPDQKLCGIEIRGGYAFWIEDESEIHRAQEDLRKANELIEQENDLIRVETEQKEREAYLQSRHHIYHEIAAELYPCQKRIAELLDQAVPGTDDFRDRIAQIGVLNAYVKRKTNMLLLASESSMINSAELVYALQESAVYLTLAGLQTTVAESEGRQYPSERIIALYDAFEILVEQLPGRTTAMMVTWRNGILCLALQIEQIPDTGGISLPVSVRRDEDIVYISVLAEEGGISA